MRAFRLPRRHVWAASLAVLGCCAFAIAQDEKPAPEKPAEEKKAEEKKAEAKADEKSAEIKPKTVVTNLDNAMEDYPHDAKGRKRMADLRVFVDGELRYQRLGFRRVDGDAPVSVELSPEDRFLTIISTDSDGDTSYDHVVLIDPVIVLGKVKRNAVESAELQQPSSGDRKPWLFFPVTEEARIEIGTAVNWIRKIAS